MKVIRWLLHILAWPVHQAAHYIAAHHPSKRRLTMLIGLLLAVLGSYLSKHPPAWVHEIVWDAFSYSIHGFGIAPIVKAMADLVKLEV